MASQLVGFELMLLIVFTMGAFRAGWLILGAVSALPAVILSVGLVRFFLRIKAFERERGAR